MPSHRVHGEAAERCAGIPREVASRVDREIDLGVVHDLGRRMPGRPPLYKALAGAGDARAREERRRRAQRVLAGLLADPDACRAFYLHHALDALASRLVAAVVLGVDTEKACPWLAERVIEDTVTPMAARLGGSCWPGFEGGLHNALRCACRLSSLHAWAREAGEAARREPSPSLDDVLASMEELAESARAYEAALLLGSVVYAVHRGGKVETIEVEVNGRRFRIKAGDEESLREALREALGLVGGGGGGGRNPYFYGRLRRLIVDAAARASRLYYAIQLCTLPQFVAKDLLSVSRRRYSLARKLFRCYASAASRREALECARREVEQGHRLSSSCPLLDESTIDGVLLEFAGMVYELVEALRRLGVDPLVGVR